MMDLSRTSTTNILTKRNLGRKMSTADYEGAMNPDRLSCINCLLSIGDLAGAANSSLIEPRLAEGGPSCQIARGVLFQRKGGVKIV